MCLQYTKFLQGILNLQIKEKSLQKSENSNI